MPRARSLLAALCLAVARGFVDDVDGYDSDDPRHAHTSKAIAYDQQGQRDRSRIAFESAARFDPTTRSLVNLGVCYMRAASSSGHRPTKLDSYGRAYETMKRGSRIAASPDDRDLFKENWKALLRNFELESVPVPDDVETVGNFPDFRSDDSSNPFDAADQPRDHRQCGAPPPQRNEDPAAAARIKAAEAAKLRPFLLHQRDAPLADAIPRVNASDLEGFKQFLERRDPFILLGATGGWKAVAEAGGSDDAARRWLDAIARRWPRAVTDFYPYNMLSSSRQAPYLTRLARGVRELRLAPGPDQQARGSAFRHETGNGAMAGRYMHLQLSPAMWGELEDAGQLGKDRHWHLENDGWLEECLGHPGSDVSAEYHLKTHWKILLVGARGAGMFNHSDSLQTSSWHATVAGRKWWHLCGKLSTGNPACFEGIVEPGEILYYGRGWNHETQNVDDPTATLTDTAVHAQNYGAVADKLHSECGRRALDFKFSGALCDALDSCYTAMQRRFGGGGIPQMDRWPAWRTVAGKDLVATRDAASPLDNNYDGRNYITE